ncbi:hypothetical protein FNV43_RR11989 [Rhamnella rubrinervis]|uniref:Uncharacterized protein n=1 Tax=Rhamnella rubrinervis TaxID=2594499 RepID=A0A8K0MHU6_9ROSA|nr:hypothetical protein FNV43_RR11989 [Rhamnella rubrinervis]
MEPVAFVMDKFKGFAKWSQNLVDGLIHGRCETSDRRNPIDILKRLQRETFSDLMKVRDRQDKVERMLSLYGTAKGSPFQEASTLVKGDVDHLGAFLMINNADNQDYDALGEAGIRTGIDSRFTFETTVGGNNTLGVEFVSSQKHNNNLGDALGSSLSLAKVFYMANVSDWFSAIAIPMGAKGRDVAFMTDPSHQGKGLTDVTFSGPPLLNLCNGSALGLMVKKSNFVASLAQFVSELEMEQDSNRIRHRFSTFGQVLCQLPRGMKLSLLGLLQLRNLPHQRGNHGALTFSLGGAKSESAPEPMIGAFAPPVGTNSQGNATTGSIALMLESEIDEIPKVGCWIEMEKSNPRYLQWAVSMSDDSEDSLGWGMRFSGTIESPTDLNLFGVESYMKFNFGKRFSVKPGIAYIMSRNAKVAAFMLRSNWSL